MTTLRRELLELGQQLAEFEQRHDELLQKSQANEALVAELEQSVEMYSSKQVPNNEKLVGIFVNHLTALKSLSTEFFA